MSAVTFTITGLAEVRRRMDELAAAGDGINGVQAVVGTNVNYARFVEQGTRFMHARPYLEPALEQNRNAILNRMDRAMSDVIAGASASTLATALNAAGLEVQADAQRTVPVKTGNLRRSLHTEVFSR